MLNNLIKTGLLLGVLTAIFGAVGFVVGGYGGMVVALMLALATNVYSWWHSGSVVLRAFRAREVSAQEAPGVYEVVAKLTARAGLPMPRVNLIDSPQPNAFATGRNPQNAVVCVSTGLLDLLDLRELAGVLGHELAHVSNRDTLTMTVAATLAGAISMFANLLQVNLLFGGRRDTGRYGVLGVLAAALVAPFAAGLVQMAISRSREFEADRVGATLCGDPEWLADALRKIQDRVRTLPNPQAQMHPSMAHLFIVNPLSGLWSSLFTTHPSTERRIALLDQLAAEWHQPGAHPPPLLDIPDDGAAGEPGLAKGPWS